jgi:hypothetical protein
VLTGDDTDGVETCVNFEEFLVFSILIVIILCAYWCLSKYIITHSCLHVFYICN